jgi:hypothetical protein
MLGEQKESLSHSVHRRAQKSVDQGKLSVSGHFKSSLLDLMDKMLAAAPHFIRFVADLRLRSWQPVMEHFLFAEPTMERLCCFPCRSFPSQRALLTG